LLEKGAEEVLVRRRSCRLVKKTLPHVLLFKKKDAIQSEIQRRGNGGLKGYILICQEKKRGHFN